MASGGQACEKVETLFQRRMTGSVLSVVSGNKRGRIQGLFRFVRPTGVWIPKVFSSPLFGCRPGRTENDPWRKGWGFRVRFGGGIEVRFFSFRGHPLLRFYRGVRLSGSDQLFPHHLLNDPPELFLPLVFHQNVLLLPVFRVTWNTVYARADALVHFLWVLAASYFFGIIRATEGR